MTTKKTSEWMWWAGTDGDFYTVGPCDTKQQVIDEMVDSGMGEPFDNGEFSHIFCITEATNPPIILSDWICVDCVLENADESLYDNDRVSSEYDDAIFAVTEAQDADLQLRLKKACDEWQTAHGLTFKSRTFEGMRNQETIRLPRS